MHFAGSEQSCAAMPPPTLWTFRKYGLADYDGHDKGTKIAANGLIICAPLEHTEHTSLSPLST